MTLAADIHLHLGELDLDLELAVGAGEVVALLGPNGAGKTTVLRALAGLQPIASGRIAIGDLVVDEPTTDTFEVPERRPVGVVFQDYLLFPHLTVLENVAFGLRSRGVAKAEARADGRRVARPGRRGRAGRLEAPRHLGRPGPAHRARPRAGHRSATCCCSTSRSPRSTPAPARRCVATSAGSSPSSRGRR